VAELKGLVQSGLEPASPIDTELKHIVATISESDEDRYMDNDHEHESSSNASALSGQEPEDLTVAKRPLVLSI
jgi:hypothetical protein